MMRIIPLTEHLYGLEDGTHHMKDFAVLDTVTGRFVDLHGDGHILDVDDILSMDPDSGFRSRILALLPTELWA